MVMLIIPPHKASPARYCVEQSLSRLLQRFVSKDDDMILDFGCGSGVYRFLFRDKNYHGFDVVNDQFQMKGEKKVQFIVADGRSLPFRNETFDFVLCNAVFEHIKEDYEAAKEVYSVLEEGKYCCIIVPANLTMIYDELPFILSRIIGKHVEGHAYHYYTEERLTRLLQNAGFKIQLVTYSMGFASTILKAFYFYHRSVKRFRRVHISSSNRLRPQKNRPRLFCDSATPKAKNFKDLKRIQGKENERISISSEIYTKLLQLCFFLDEKLNFLLGGEILCFAKKEQ